VATVTRSPAGGPPIGELPDRPDEDKPDTPSAGEVLGAVLACSARSFLLNDSRGGTGPLDPTEQVHQSRVALRRIRSNLRTFRVLFDPAWNTSVRAELAWYTDRLGASRDLHVLRDSLVLHRPPEVRPSELAVILTTLDRGLVDADSSLAEARAGDRHAALVRTIELLTGRAPFGNKASSPADELLPTLLERSWRDAREAARSARRQPDDRHLHALRIRMKALRYGCETVSLVAGAPARKTARAAEALQERLGTIHDAYGAAAWLESVAEGSPALEPVVARLREAQLAVAASTRAGWRKEFNKVERCWRRWRR